MAYLAAWGRIGIVLLLVIWLPICLFVMAASGPTLGPDATYNGVRLLAAYILVDVAALVLIGVVSDTAWKWGIAAPIAFAPVLLLWMIALR
jgi:hypothetical protein